MSAPLVMPSPKATHYRDGECDRTFCGRLIVAGMQIYEPGGPLVDCKLCLKNLKELLSIDSIRRTEAFLHTLALAKCAYEAWCAHQGVPFEYLDVAQQQAWIGVVEALWDKFEDEPRRRHREDI